MEILLTIYLLMWPLIVLGVLITIASAFVRDVREAKKEGRPVI